MSRTRVKFNLSNTKKLVGLLLKSINKEIGNCYTDIYKKIYEDAGEMTDISLPKYRSGPFQGLPYLSESTGNLEKALLGISANVRITLSDSYEFLMNDKPFDGRKITAEIIEKLDQKTKARDMPEGYWRVMEGYSPFHKGTRQAGSDEFAFVGKGKTHSGSMVSEENVKNGGPDKHPGIIPIGMIQQSIENNAAYSKKRKREMLTNIRSQVKEVERLVIRAVEITSRR